MVTRVHAGDGTAAGRIRDREPRLRADRGDPEAGDRRLPVGRGQDLLHPSGRRHRRASSRRSWTNVENVGSDRRPVGASTITQQVAKNFLLTNEVSDRAQGQGSDPRLPHRAGLHQGSHPRALSEPNLSGQRLLRRRGSGAELFQQVAGRADDRRGGLSRRPAEGAEQLQHPCAITRRRIDRRNWVIGRMRGGRLHHGGGGERRKGRAAGSCASRAEAEHVVARIFRRGGAPRARCSATARMQLYKGGLSVRDDARSQAAGDRRQRAARAAWSPMTCAMAGAARCGHVDRVENWAKRLARPSPCRWLEDLAARRSFSTVDQADGRRSASPTAADRPAFPSPSVLGATCARRRRARSGPARQARPSDVLPRSATSSLVEPLVEGRQGEEHPRRTFAPAPDPGGARRPGRARPAYRPRAGDDRRLVVTSSQRVQPRDPGASASRARPSSRSSIWRRSTTASRRRPWSSTRRS